ncbi:hypothetical protein ACFFU9_00705 [Mariniflexile ostreae]|uniref:Oligosaccharide repeat unit polymerase n=1 Tax=Mariniflexile ostreae TaxID=1520892 RepID=A0ABV5F723_9FLAO
MFKEVTISAKWIQNKIVWTLLLIPLCFKVEIISNVIVLPQEIILPFLIFLYFFTVRKVKTVISKTVLPYIYLFVAFVLTIIITLFSLLKTFDIVGLLKLIKYSIYVVSIIIIYDYKFPNFIKRINIVSAFTIIFTLFTFYITKLQSGHTWSTYIAMATYVSEYMPTGFSNRVFNFQSQSFIIYSGNHGIYGSYLALLLFFNISGIIRGTSNKGLVYIVIFLSFLNIMLLTSRETFLLIVITLFSFSFYHLSYMKFNPTKVFIGLVFFIFFIIVLIWAIDFYDIELSIVNKMTNSIRKFKEEGGDGSVDVRFNTWLIIFIYLFTYPWRLFSGIGFNPTLFRNELDLVAISYPNIGKYVGIPESLFIQFLSYGGVLSLLLVIMFMLNLFKNLLKKINTKNGIFIPFYVLGLSVTNNTGASIIAELLMTQFALIYLFIMNSHGEKKHIIYNR